VAIERPTFHESWYRVAEIHPRLRSTVQVSRQHFRGQLWYVIQDHTNNAFFRLAEPAYRYIGLLDGKRSVAEAWKYANEQLGDDSPTQGEVIQLLGQLYTANLLQAEIPPDTHTLFARYKKRKSREVAGYLMNIMFARLPLFDPNAFLNRWISVLGLIFSPLGFVVWMVLLGTGIYQIMNYPGWFDEMSRGAAGLLSPENLVLLYVAFAFIKAFHEMGHAISCKKFGRQGGTGGEVHVIGIMLLVFTPVPYVDASSSWAMTSKWHRAIVGIAGMWVELAIASIAAMVWANSGEAHWIHHFAYNVMFVASFSTVLFNANPLLRYDGYYILSDLLEIPNLGQRANQYIYYLVKRYAWGVRFARSSAYSRSEAVWLAVYAVASFLMRVLVSCSIMLYLAGVLNGTLILIALIMAVAGILTWVLVPLGRLAHYLATSGELARVRFRAITTTLLFVAALITAVGLIPFPDHARAQGVVEPANMQELFIAIDGFVTKLSPAITDAPQIRDTTVRERLAESETQRSLAVASRIASDDRLAVPIVKKDELLLSASNPARETELKQFFADRQRLETRLNIARTKDPGEAAIVEAALRGVNDQIAITEERIKQLQLKAPLDGTLVVPELETRKQAFLKQGERIGVVADLSSLIIRAAAGNSLSGPLDTETDPQVEIRVSGRPDILLTGHIAAKFPAGEHQLPSAALGYQVGGEFNTAPDDRQGTKAVENFFEVRIDSMTVKEPEDLKRKWEQTGELPLLPGQRVVVRFNMRSKPLAVQAWTSLLQLFQRKFQM